MQNMNTKWYIYNVYSFLRITSYIGIPFLNHIYPYIYNIHKLVIMGCKLRKVIGMHIQAGQVLLQISSGTGWSQQNQPQTRIIYIYN